MQLIAEELCVPLEPRHADPVRHGAARPTRAPRRARSRTPTNFNHANLALAGATAREALVRLASERLGVPGDQLVGEGRRRQRRGRPVEARELRRPRRRQEVQPRARTRARSGSIRSEWTVLGTPVPRARHPGDGHRAVRVRPQRARARHAARPRRAAAGRRRDARGRRRGVGPGHARASSRSSSRRTSSAWSPRSRGRRCRRPRR